MANNARGEREGEWLIVDGYNIIGSWGDLSALAERDLSAARDVLRDTLINHCGYTGQYFVLVFDAHQTHERERILSVSDKKAKKELGQVVYTKKAETADNYIEKFVRLHTAERMSVASSDALVQVMVFAHAQRLSARDLAQDVDEIVKQIRRHIERRGKHAIEDRLENTAFEKLDGLRRARGRELGEKK